MKDRFQRMLQEYGRVALAVYLILFAAVFLGFVVATSAGFESQGAASSAGIAGAAWIATKVTQPLRIGATMVLTPLVARVLRRAPASRTREMSDGTEV